MQMGTLTKQVMGILRRNGLETVAQAGQIIQQAAYDRGVVGDALHFYAQAVLPNVLPLFPALIHLSAKTADANPKDTTATAVAMLLISASGDIHDDIVDNSTEKFGKQTLVGKFGKNVALLAGDALLTQGLTLLQHACSRLPSQHRRLISDLVAASMYEIIKAETTESALWHKKNVTPQEYFGVIELKGGVAELHCRIGGLIGGGTQKKVDSLGRIGRAIGVLSTLKEEFVDLSNPKELLHRLKHELPPYPMICAMQEEETKNQIEAIAGKMDLSVKDMELVAKLVLDSFRVKNLEAEFRKYGQKEMENNELLKNKNASELKLLLKALSYELTLV